MSSAGTTSCSENVRLLEVEPDLGRYLTDDEFQAAGHLSAAVFTAEEKPLTDVGAQLEDAGAFAALVLEGMVLRQLAIGDQLGMRLQGPGELVPATVAPASMLVGEDRCRAVPGTRLALLDEEFLGAARRWPTLFAGLQLKSAQQSDRLITQLVICQLPRVDQRVLAMMWLLAESWGRVTPAGTTLPLSLTHDAIGAMVGARRPTVTLALRELSDRGAILRQDHGWLLLEQPDGTSWRPATIRPPGLIDERPSRWSTDALAATAPEPAPAPEPYAGLRETVAQLVEQHTRDRERFAEHLTRAKDAREQSRNSRESVADDRLKRRRPPSS